MQKVIYYANICLLIFIFLGSCSNEPQEDKLPILGNKDVDEKTGETIYHQIPDFEFINQDSVKITNASFADKVYVTDFFFIHCPSICPVMTAQMLRIHDQFENNDKVAMVSHSIDLRNDTIPALKNYANKLGVKSDKWNFVTGEEDQIFDMADDYFITARKDGDAPGGFDHSGRLILVDENRYVRSFCNGTDPEDVDRFMKDIEKLLNEK